MHMSGTPLPLAQSCTTHKPHNLLVLFSRQVTQATTPNPPLGTNEPMKTTPRVQQSLPCRSPQATKGVKYPLDISRRIPTPIPQSQSFPQSFGASLPTAGGSKPWRGAQILPPAFQFNRDPPFVSFPPPTYVLKAAGVTDAQLQHEFDTQRVHP